MKKRVGIITFHAAHNYGSSLQSYALQNVIKEMDYDCEIINFRTESQKDQYRPLTKRKGLKYVLKNAYFLLCYKARKQKYDIFENFIDKYLNKSPKEYQSLDELYNENFNYTHFISGSDQIWNTAPNDANMAYFLPFVKNGKRISYAPSFGQIGKIKHKDEIKKYLNKYDSLSIREEFGQKLIKEMTGKNVKILVDPTLLLSKERWQKLICNKPFIDGEYIFFYTLFADKEMISMVKQLSHILKIPVVISNVSNQYEIFSGFKKRLNVGPLEFLNLIYNAKMVCTSSFHGTVFSIIFNKPFISIRGLTDNRISTLLKLTNLQDASVNHPEELTTQKVSALLETDFSKAEIAIKDEQKKAYEFLAKALQE